jgi:monovalent cation:H+ antiporter-2, CPA2 family
MAIASLLFNAKLQQFYDRVEKRFLTNLNEREMQRAAKKEITPWDAHLATFEVLPEHKFVGKQLQEIKLREIYGVNIALVERGKLSILTPERHERLYPGDKLSIIGTDDQLTKLKELFDRQTIVDSGVYFHDDEISLQNFTVTKESKLYNKTIRESKLRDIGKGLVVGLERNGQRLLNPDSAVRLIEGDIVWIVGVRKVIDKFLSPAEVAA